MEKVHREGAHRKLSSFRFEIIEMVRDREAYGAKAESAVCGRQWSHWDIAQ